MVNFKKISIILLISCLLLTLFAPIIRAEENDSQPKVNYDLPKDQADKLRDKAEKFEFQAEVNKMMTLIINSLYRNKEIFLREIISNAADALDKIRFLSLTKSSLLGDNPDLSIKIQADVENNILNIIDTGVGMTHDELKNNLGTIAKSGTAEFIKKAEESKDLSLIGQFGVGFYSAFLVADRVTVTSKHNDDKQYIWESDASGGFTIVEDPRGNTIGRGTVISLHLKPEALDFLKQETLTDLIKKYSEFINFPIYLYTTKTESVEVPNDEKVTDEEIKENKEQDDEDVNVSEENEEEELEERPTTKTIEKTKSGFELMNQNKPIWVRSADDITDEEYNKFYQSFFKQTTDPLAHVHFKAEGEIEFKSVLFIPDKAPQNLYSGTEKINDIKLFVRRVFITDAEMEPLLPNYLRFIKGIVDSDDLPLNVSRETLQQNKLLKVIKKKLIRKILDLLKEMSKNDPDKFSKFYKDFATSLKLGIIEDSQNQKRIAKLLRYRTSESGEKDTTLDEVLERFKKGQENFYVLTGSSIEEIKRSPFLERLTARGYEVIYLPNPMDEYTFQTLTTYEGKKFLNAAKEGLKFGDDEEDEKSSTEKFQPLLTWLKETALVDVIEKATVSSRLTTSPCAIVVPQWAWSGNMERIMQAQAYARQEDIDSNFYLRQKKTFEINPKHPVILELLKRVEDDKVEPNTVDLAKLLFDAATLRSGYQLKNNNDFATRIEKIIRHNMEIDLEAQAEIDEERLPLASESKDENDEVDDGETEEEQQQQQQTKPNHDDDDHDEL